MSGSVSDNARLSDLAHGVVEFVIVLAELVESNVSEIPVVQPLRQIVEHG